MRIFTGEAIKKEIENKRGRILTAYAPGMIIIYPAPHLYMRPILPTYAHVFTSVLTCAPAKYPGGAYTQKRYTVDAEKNRLPEKYKKMLLAADAMTAGGYSAGEGI